MFYKGNKQKKIRLLVTLCCILFVNRTVKHKVKTDTSCMLEIKTWAKPVTRNSVLVFMNGGDPVCVFLDVTIVLRIATNIATAG